MSEKFGHEWDRSPLTGDQQITWASIVSELAHLQQQHLVSQILKCNPGKQADRACDRIQLSVRKIWKTVPDSSDAIDLK